MKRAPAPAFPPAVGPPLKYSSFLFHLLGGALAARLLFFPAAPGPRAPAPQRCGSSSAVGLAPPPLVRRASAGRLLGQARTAPKVAPEHPRSRGRPRAGGEAD